MNAGRFALVIAIVAWIGLAVQFRASFADMHAVGATLWIMLLYFTVIVNLLVALVFSALAFGRDGIATPFRLGAVVISILLVGVVYNLLLSGMIELSGGALLADFLNHSVTPCLVTIYWMLFAERRQLQWIAPFQWTIIPLAYFVYGLTRGATEGRYPYPFMDVEKLGWPQTILNGVVMAACFVATGLAMVWWNRRPPRKLA